MPPRRTIRKPTRWTPDEWCQVEAEARARGVPPLRYVREAALGHPPAMRRSRGADERVRQLGRVLNNLRQLGRVAELDGDEAAAGLLADAAGMVENAIAAAPAVAGAGAAEGLAVLIDAGAALNALAHRANGAEELPPADELLTALAHVDAAVRGEVAA
ncbi:MAG TPA: hypothetical protein VF092_17320 [Longimicrobium sp.]